MSREILFRARNTNTEEMVTDIEISFVHKARKYEDEEFEGNDVWYDFENFPIMQYTGFLDKNGVKIFEGDIVFWKHVKTGKETYHIVERKAHTDSHGYFHIEYVGFENVSFGEVVGNIYENESLLRNDGDG